MLFDVIGSRRVFLLFLEFSYWVAFFWICYILLTCLIACISRKRNTRHFEKKKTKYMRVQQQLLNRNINSSIFFFIFVYYKHLRTHWYILEKSNPISSSPRKNNRTGFCRRDILVLTKWLAHRQARDRRRRWYCCKAFRNGQITGIPPVIAETSAPSVFTVSSRLTPPHNAENSVYILIIVL